MYLCLIIFLVDLKENEEFRTESSEIVNSYNCLPESLTSNDDRVKAALVKSAFKINPKDEMRRILSLKKRP